MFGFNRKFIQNFQNIIATALNFKLFLAQTMKNALDCLILYRRLKSM